MEQLEPKFIEVLNYLFPGLLCAWVYFGLTGFPRPQAVERIIQALIFTGIVQGCVYVEGWIAEYASRFVLWGPWNHDVAAWITALAVGFQFARWAMTDKLFGWLRTAKITQQMSYPTVWYGAFQDEVDSWVTLHLEDGRRISGWPSEWSPSPEKGFVKLSLASWEASEENQEAIPLTIVSSVLIRVDTIKWVEFFPYSENADDATNPEPAAASPVIG
jgi:hypothetical protein